MLSYQEIIDRYYPAGSSLRDIYMVHCRSVANLALALNARQREPLDPALVEEAAMLHDIGIFRCDAPSIECRGDAPYICHGVIGASLLRELGVDERIARVAERHTGTGITAEEVMKQQLPIPPRDYLPETRLERLVCYADKFFSKSGDMKAKTHDKVRASMARHGQASVERFDKLVDEFGKIENEFG